MVETRDQSLDVSRIHFARINIRHLPGLSSLGRPSRGQVPDDKTVPVVATNAPNPSLGDGWEYVSYAAREYSSEEPPKVPV